MIRSLFIATIIFAAGCSKHEPAHPGQMSHEEMWSRMEQAATPGHAHLRLSPLVGEWNTETKVWMEPGKAPEVSHGRASSQWILGDRFISEEYSGSFGGKPFRGVATLGYDNVSKKYVGSWIDSMGTGMMTSEGQFNQQSNALEMTGTMSCPVTNGPRSSRMVTRIIDNKTHVMEMFDSGFDGKETKMMEITYRRTA